MKKRAVIVVFVGSLVLMLASWSSFRSKPTAGAAKPAMLGANPRQQVPDDRLDGAVFEGSYAIAFVVDSPERVPDYPSDGRLFRDAYLQHVRLSPAGVVPDFPLDGQVFSEVYRIAMPESETAGVPDFPADGRVFVAQYPELGSSGARLSPDDALDAKIFVDFYAEPTE